MEKNVLQALERINYRGSKNQIFRPLHFAYGFDFQADFDVFEINGKFTINSIHKLTAENGYTPDDLTVAIIQDPTSCHKDDLIVVRIFRTDFSIEYRCPVYGINSRLDYIFRRGDFNDIRKKDDIVTWIVCQKKELTTPVYKKPEIDYTWRFKYLSDGHGYTDRYGKHYNLYKVNLQTTDGRNLKIEYSPEPTNDRSDFIDKSGYIVDSKRDHLKRRAEGLRRERAKNAYNAIDNSPVINKLSDRIATLKNRLQFEFSAVKTADDMKALNNRLKWYKGFEGVLDDFEYIVNKDSNKGFSDMQAFQNKVDNLNRKIDNLLDPATADTATA